MHLPIRALHNTLRLCRVMGCLLTSVLSIAVGNQVHAIDTWDNNFPDGFGSGQWSFNSSWLDNTEPTSSDLVIFPAGFPNGAATVRLSAGEVAQSLTINDSYTFANTTAGSDAATLQLSVGEIFVANGKSARIDVRLINAPDLTKTGAGTLTMTRANTAQGIVDISAGTLMINAGGSVTGITGIVGGVPGSDGTVTIDGLGSTWTTSGNLGVGNGTLTISNGAAVVTNGLFGTLADASTSDAEVNVVGQGSSWNLNSALLTVGDDGAAALNILDGGNVFNLDALVGADMGSTGTVHVSGAGSDWINLGSLTVGDSGVGALNIEAAGSVSSEFAVIGSLAGSVGTVLVDGPGSSWTNNSSLQVGNSGQASLTITNGGTVSAAFTEIGGVVGIASFATVDGDGSLWTNTGLLEVGDNGDAELTISNGGTATSGQGGLADAAAADALVTVTGAGSRWDMSGGTGTLYVGEDGTGTLNILDGGAVANVASSIAFDLGSTGTALVSGAGSTWSHSGSLVVGGEGDGELTIAAGGSVSSTAPISEAGGTIGAIVGSTGTVTVAGAGSEWTTNNSDLVVGESGTGNLTIENGGSVSNGTNGNGYIGKETGGSGAVAVIGAGSTWTNGTDVLVGYFGTGTLTIADGGSVADGDGRIGTLENSIGIATVSGAGSSWSNSRVFRVGSFGHGTLLIEQGGTVSFGTIGIIARGADSTGNVTVTGAGSTWTAGGNFVVGFQGIAELMVQNGGKISSKNSWIAGATTSTATVTVAGAGSNWTIAGRLAISDAFDPDELGPGGGTGTLSVQSGAKVTVAEETALFPGATLNLEGGTLDTAFVTFNGGGAFNFLSGTLHVGTFNGNLVNQSGTLAPGHSAGSTTITGSYAQQSGGKLQIEIGGTSPGSTYDVVTITSLAGISGQLQLAMLNGFVPSPSDTFTVLSSTIGIFGVFSNVANGQRLTTLDSLGSFLVHYGLGSAFNPNQIVLSAFVPAELPGDFNFDGTVDAADYVVWRKGLGTTHTQNGFNIWRAHFGQTAGSGSGATADVSSNAPPVPEPASLLLVGLSVAMARCRSRCARAFIARCL